MNFEQTGTTDETTRIEPDDDARMKLVDETLEKNHASAELRPDFGEPNKQESSESEFTRLENAYQQGKRSYDDLAKKMNEAVTSSNEAIIQERHASRRQLEALETTQKEWLREHPKQAEDIIKQEWRQFYRDAFSSGRVYDDVKHAGAPTTHTYELAFRALNDNLGFFDADGDMKRADAALQEAHQEFLQMERTKREAEEGERRKHVELPEQKEIVTASEGPQKVQKESLPNPKMDAYILDTYLSYADAPVSAEERQRMLDFNRKSLSAQNYATSLRHLAERRNLSELDALAKEMIAKVKEVLDRLGIPISAYGNSKSWALWDIGKQEYFAEHPEEANENYAVGGILELPEKREEIVNRHIGWELYGAYTNGNRGFVEKIGTGEKEEVEELLKTPPKENRTLPSYKLARLGMLARK